jgi:hypothetical protein
MIIVPVGPRQYGYRKVGYVADFCPLCRCPTVFQLLRIGVSRQTAKIYHDAGKDHLIKHIRICQGCSTELIADRTTYAAVSKKSSAVAILIADTFPNIREVHHKRLALEDRIRDSPGSLSADQRLAMIREPVVLLAPGVDRLYKVKSPGPRVLAYVAAHLVMIAGLIIWEPKMHAFGWLALLFFASLSALAMWRVKYSRQQFMQGKIVPLLTRTFHLLKPTPMEMQIVLDEMQRHDRKIGFVLRPEDVA